MWFPSIITALLSLMALAANGMVLDGRNTNDTEAATLESRELESRASLRGGYWTDKACFLKGRFGTDLTPYGTYGYASCIPQGWDSGKFYTATINLNTCLKNDNGVLKWAMNGNGIKSCRACSSRQFNGWDLSCECKNKKGEWPRTWINLNEGIYHEFSLLKCFGLPGRTYIRE